MPGVAVDEAAIRAAIDAGVRAALAALNPHDASEVSGIAEDSYPDYDEYGNEAVPSAAEQTHFWNDRSIDDAEDDTIEPAGGFGNVVPMSAQPSAAHTVSQEWLAAQWAREPEYVRNPPMHPHFVDMWAGV